MFSKFFPIALCCALFTNYAHSQGNADSSYKDGLVVYNKAFTRHFMILMQDTTLPENRFSNLFTSAGQPTPGKVIQFAPVIVDNILLIRSEKKLLGRDTSDKVYNYSRNRLLHRVKSKKYIHLLVAFIDESNKLNVVVQFVAPREFKKHSVLYKNRLWLLAGQKHLRFAVITF